MKLSVYTSEFKKNIQLAYPVMLGQLGHVLVGFADSIMVGELGPAPLAAVSLANSLAFIAFSVGIGFTFAITPLIAEAHTSNNVARGKNYFQHGILMSLILSLVLCAALFLMKPLMYKMDQPVEVVEYASPYYDIIMYSMIPMLLFQAYKQFSDGMSQTKYPMRAAILANVINVLLNYLLIYGKFGFPKMELIGAGLGTLISRVLMLGFIMYIVHTKDVFAVFVDRIKFSNFKKRFVAKVFNVGYPSALQMFFEVGIFAGGILLTGMIGTKAQAANQISLNLATMTYMIAVGLSVTATIRVGNQKGRKDFVSMKRIAMSVLFLMLIIDLFLAAGFILLKDVLPLLYIEDTEVVMIAAQLLIVAGLFQISDGIQVVFLGALRGLQDVKCPMVITFVAFWIIGFPVSYYLGLKTELEALGVWIGMLVSLTISAIMLYLRFDKLTNRMIKENSGKL
ncbi:MATE family efflux transporter [Flavicella sp.]|uniref:MATE family efflux transporter n=1 Tax=Flavicella sp. TaxID=2957742 RepID=UPI002620CCCD|nr:MATE family efflux transporter [Flavicella sp.]MDG1803959.1 MATE family efflux transporter [Flavicella sp.]